MTAGLLTALCPLLDCMIVNTVAS